MSFHFIMSQVSQKNQIHLKDMQRSYKVEIIESKDPLVQLEASK